MTHSWQKWHFGAGNILGEHCHYLVAISFRHHSDAAPIIGTIDDILVLWLGGTPLMKQIASTRSRRVMRAGEGNEEMA